MKNPFSGFGTIVKGDRFVGRELELQLLTGRLSSLAGSISLIGEPRIGKSSLALEAVQRITDAGNTAVVIWIDASTLPGPTELFLSILDSSVEVLKDQKKELSSSVDNIINQPVISSYDAYRRCRRGLLQLHREGVDIIVVIDEFDAVRSIGEASTTIQRLRELIDHKYETGLITMFISRRSLKAIEIQISDVSTLDGVCEQFYVRPLAEPDIKAMINRCGPEWSPTSEDESLLFSYTGGHPYLSELILCHSWDALSFETGVQRSVATMFDFYERLRQLLDEGGLFTQLLQIAVGPRWSVKPGSVERLLRYGIVREIQTEDRIMYKAWSDHFQSYLEKCTRETPMNELWHETEKGVRDFIEDICADSYGSDWMTKLAGRHKSIALIKQSGEEMREKEARNFGSSISRRLLDYTYPMDLWGIISAEWDLFRTKFGKEKKYWAERFSHLSKVRTPTAHSRESAIPEHELTLAQAYCKELLTTIKPVD